MNAVHTDIFVFDGQGTSASFSPPTTQSAIRDAETPMGHVLLLACHLAFIQEFETLTLDERLKSEIDLGQFQVSHALLDVPPNARNNALVATVNLYLTQLLRFVASADQSLLGNSVTNHNTSTDVELLGFSMGILVATVVATSNNIPMLLSRSVETLRLAFWLGFRSHIFASSLKRQTPAPHADSPFSLVVFGSSREIVQETVSRFNADNCDGLNVYLAAATSSKCFSISGRPDVIAKFKAENLPITSMGSHLASIYALYHTHELKGVKSDVIDDLARRSITFPSYKDIVRPIRSSVDGLLIDASGRGNAETLVEAIIDMILLYPVNFDLVTDISRSEKIAWNRPIRLVNIGPGAGLWRSIAKAFQGIQVSTDDWSCSSTLGPVPEKRIVRIGASQKQEPIAVVGMGVFLPAAKNIEEFWTLLEEGLNTVSEIPETRFDVSRYLYAEDASGRSLKTKYGNFLQDVDVFDNAFFHISPREARMMDPQQRVLLQVAYHALQNAGYVPNMTSTFNPDTFGSYVGVATNEYVQNLRNTVDVYYSTSTLQAFLSGKLSYAFGFGGPSVVVDTACSSSVVAIHQACRALANGDCRAALAGGVNIITSPDMYLGLDRAHFLSPTGQCRPWDALADGYCRAEGCGMFVLKRLSDALSENDRILGVIRGVEVNQSGQAESMTHPHVPSQVKLYRRLLASTGIHPHQISVIEAHGTGTQVGDPAELEGLRSVLAVDRPATNPLHVTSVKANIGHSEAASGAASLAKLILMIRAQTIPPTISLKQLNPAIPDLLRDNVRIDVQSAVWECPRGQKRLALLNNFGAAGSNAALILEEPPLPKASSLQPPSALVLGLSAKSEEAARRLRDLHILALTSTVHEQPALMNFAYTATSRRQVYMYRISVSGHSQEEICKNLKDAKVVKIDDRRNKLGFVFSGQGGQYLGMGSGLYANIPSFRRIVDECHHKLLSWGFPGILGVIQAVSSDFSDRRDTGDVEVSQSATFVLECALSRLWASWGVKPDVIVGHSLGEYAAMVCAEMISIDDALWLVAARAKLMKQHCEYGRTGMLSVRMGPREVKTMCDDRHLQGIVIACYNSETDCVVAGDTTSLSRLETSCSESQIECTRLHVPYAYHSPAMDPILEELRIMERRVSISAPTTPILSTVFGRFIQPGDNSIVTADYFSRHCREPVLFQQALQNLGEKHDLSDICAWMEVGPHPVTLSIIRKNQARVQTIKYMTTLRRQVPDCEAMCLTLAELYQTSVPISWPLVFADIAPDARLVDVPLYPFAQTRYWIPYKESIHETVIREEYSMVDLALPQHMKADPVAHGRVARVDIDVGRLSSLIDGHNVAGHALCPASVYYQLAAKAVLASKKLRERTDPEFVLEVLDIEFEEPLIHVPGADRTVTIEVKQEGTDKQLCSFSVNSSASMHDSSSSHCQGLIKAQYLKRATSKLSSSRDWIERRRASLNIGTPGTDTIYAHDVYNGVFSRLVKYSYAYQTVKTVTTHSDGTGAFAIMQAPLHRSLDCQVAHPVFMDTLMHVAGYVLNSGAGEDEVFICSQIDEILVLPKSITPSAMYGVYCHIGFLSDAMAIADTYAITLDGKEGQVVAHMKKIRFRRLKLSRFQKSLQIQTLPQEPLRSLAPAGHVRPDETNLEAEIISVIADVCRIDTENVNVRSRIVDLGIDLLMAVEIVGRLRSLLHELQMEPSIVMTHERVGDLIKAIEGDISHSSPMPCDACPITGGQRPADRHLAQCNCMQNQLKNIIASVLGIPANRIADKQDLTLLGLDSLSYIEARYAIQATFRVGLAANVFSTCRTIQDLASSIAKRSSTISERCMQQVDLSINPTSLQDNVSESSVPLFLIHDGSGLVFPYTRLLALDRQVWGIHSPHLTTGQGWKCGLLEMAANYVSLVERTIGHGECILGGWSFGGVVGFEMARQLLARGIQVKGLILIDSPAPSTHCALPDSVIDSVISTRDPPSKITHEIRAHMRHASQALVDYDPAQSPAHQVHPPKTVMLRSEDGFPVKDVDRHTASFLADRSDPAVSIVGWAELLGTTSVVIDIPGNHFEPFEPRNVATVTERLKEALAILDVD